MFAMYASNSVYDVGGSSGSKPYYGDADHSSSQNLFGYVSSHPQISQIPVLKQMPFPNQMLQMNNHFAFVS